MQLVRATRIACDRVPNSEPGDATYAARRRRLGKLGHGPRRPSIGAALAPGSGLLDVDPQVHLETRALALAGDTPFIGRGAGGAHQVDAAGIGETDELLGVQVITAR
ncbi:MAG: hypothetical protein ACLQKH_11260 [Steroidobacteraceae bacterium]